MNSYFSITLASLMMLKIFTFVARTRCLNFVFLKKCIMKLWLESKTGAGDFVQYFVSVV